MRNILLLFLLINIDESREETRKVPNENWEYKRLLLTDPDVLANRLSVLESRIVQLETDRIHKDNVINQQAASIKSLQQQFNQASTAGSTYIIWGKKSCPLNNDTEEVYSGYAASGSSSDSGSSPDMLCLPISPVSEKTSGQDYGRVYGVEYDSDFFAPHENGQDMPCAVCHRKYSTSSIMIPGRNSCFPGWSMEYKGYIASGYHTATVGANFFCLAENHEYLAGGEANTNVGSLIGPVVAKCGVLKCPPYHTDYPLTCVMCSK